MVLGGFCQTSPPSMAGLLGRSKMGGQMSCLRRCTHKRRVCGGGSSSQRCLSSSRFEVSFIWRKRNREIYIFSIPSRCQWLHSYLGRRCGQPRDLTITLTKLPVSRIPIFNHTFYLISYLISLSMAST